MAGAPDAVARLADAQLPFLGAGKHQISAYIAHGSELDPSALIQVLAGAGHDLCLPVVAGPARPLLFRRWRAGDSLQDGAMNIPAPLPDAPTVTPHILLVPLLIVDRTGIRLGYGGGFYDRTLEALRAQNPANPPVAVGVCYGAQVVDQVPRDVHDQPLDWILTPDFTIEIPTPTAPRA